MSQITTCISVYRSHQAAEQALVKLQAGYADLQQVSLVGKGCHNEAHPVGFYSVGGRSRYWGLQAAFWDGMSGRLNGAGIFWLPAFGALVASGPIVGLLVKGIEGGSPGGGFSVLGAALFSLGVPRQVIMQYESSVLAARFLLIVHGAREDAEQTCGILHDQSQQVTVHTASCFEMPTRPTVCR